jgi:hypothetical protein
MNTSAVTNDSRTESDLASDTAPNSGPPVCRIANPAELKALGLPFRCEGGRILQDQCINLDDEESSDREFRYVYFEHGGVFQGVQYSRPIDVPIVSEFDAWPNANEILNVSFYDLDHLGRLGVRIPPTH